MKQCYLRFVLVLMTLGSLTGTTTGQGSLNMTLLSNWTNASIPLSSSGNRYNDVTGYANAGREYAILGATNGTHFIDITIPTAPVHIAVFSGCSATSPWRDMEVYGNHLYVVCDQGASASLQIFNLSTLPAAPTKVLDTQAFFTTAHTLTIDQSRGRLYVSGSSAQPNGILIFDIQTNPASPTLLANFVLGAYTHDVVVIRDTCYGFFGGGGFVGAFDFADLNNPSALGSLFSYPEIGYAHSGAVTDGLDYLYFATETHNTGIHIADISDPYSITHKGTFRSTLLGPTHVNSVGHNPYIRDSILYVSYYQDGLQMWDISNPENPVRIAYYDTHPQSTDYTGWRGAWGTYAGLPSGNILVSDTENGLYVLRYNNSFPVELQNFAAVKRDDHVYVSWRTESEQNNQGFYVERSDNKFDFREIGFVAGAGNSNTTLYYDFKDTEPLRAETYYRLRQVDLNGESSQSEIVTVRATDPIQMLAVYPSPATAGEVIEVLIHMENDKDVYASLTSTLGQQVWSSKLEGAVGDLHFSIPTQGYASGAYFLKVANSDHVSTQRIIIENQGN